MTLACLALPALLWRVDPACAGSTGEWSTTSQGCGPIQQTTSNWGTLTDAQAVDALEAVYAWLQDSDAPVSVETGNAKHAWIDDMFKLSDAQIAANGELLIKILESENPPCSDDGLRGLAAVLLGRDPARKGYLLQRTYDWRTSWRMSEACMTGLVFSLTESEYQALAKEREAIEALPLSSVAGVRFTREQLDGSHFQNAFEDLTVAWDLRSAYAAEVDTKSKTKVLCEWACARSKWPFGLVAPVLWARWELKSLCEKYPLDVATAVLEVKAEMLAERTALDDAKTASREVEFFVCEVRPWLTEAVIDLIE